MRLIAIFLLSISLGCQAQNKETLYADFNKHFDSLGEKFFFNSEIDENQGYKKLSYENLNLLLKIDNESLFEITNTDLVDFYAIGKINLPESHTGYIIYEKYKNYDMIDRELFLAIFSSENRFIGMTNIGSLTDWDESNFTSVVHVNGTIVKQMVTHNTYKKFNFEKVDGEIIWYFQEIKEKEAIELNEKENISNNPN